MATKKYFSRLTLRGDNYSGSMEPAERIRTLGIVNTDYNCFKKSKAEKELLRIAKMKAKIYLLNK